MGMGQVMHCCRERITISLVMHLAESHSFLLMLTSLLCRARMAVVPVYVLSHAPAGWHGFPNMCKALHASRQAVLCFEKKCCLRPPPCTFMCAQQYLSLDIS